MTTAFTLEKYFSGKSAFLMTVAAEELTNVINYYGNKELQLCIYILLKTSEDFELFVEARKNRKMNRFPSLAIFDSENKTLMEICKYPGENYFNLVFDVKLMVVCMNEDIPIREWYSIYPTTTEVMDLFIWSRHSGLVEINNKTWYEKRNNLRGISLRVTQMKVSILITSHVF